MKKLVLIIILLGVYFGADKDKLALLGNLTATEDNTAIINAYQRQRSDVQVQGSGRVVKTLADDLFGSRHQRFIVKIADNLTVLIAHNIDLADKITSLKSGDNVSFYGEYEWNKKGGVIHWTHRDPKNRHRHGWIKHQGITYQ